MSDLTDIIHILPPMKSGNELLSALEVLPEYDVSICAADTPVRLMALSDLYRVYVPSQMSLEIYSKLYLALMRSLQKKGTTLATQQRNQNYRAIMQQECSGIMGGSDSFTIIGASGIGKVIRFIFSCRSRTKKKRERQRMIFVHPLPLSSSEAEITVPVHREWSITGYL